MGETISIGIFKEKRALTVEEIKATNLVFTLSGKSFRNRSHHIHTYADPFLFEDKGELYLFAEIQAIGEPGYINCWHYRHDAIWEDIGIVLKEATHYSYPFIIKDRSGEIYIIPESGQTKEISMWKFDNFPHSLKKVTTILSGVYFDSSIIYHEGEYFLFTTNEANELLIFFSDKLLADNWTPHPYNPVTNNKKISRNGGGVVLCGNNLIRIAQNCTDKYGQGIIILNITKLDKSHYEESVIIEDFKPLSNYEWQRKGRHHLSFCNFKSNTFIAMDGFSHDLIINKFINVFYKFLKK